VSAPVVCSSLTVPAFATERTRVRIDLPRRATCFPTTGARRAVWMQQDDAGNIEDQLNRLWVKHADAWLSIIEAYWRVSENPAFAWLALALHLDPARENQPLPLWLAGYLATAANNMTTVIFAVDPKKVPGVIPQVLGLTRPKGRIIAEARELWTAGTLLGLYNALKSTADGTARAEQAHVYLCELWPFQSVKAAKDAVRRARQDVGRLLDARGLPVDAASVSAAAADALRLALAVDRLFRQFALSRPNLAELRATFGLTPERRSAIESAINRTVGPQAKKG